MSRRHVLVSVLAAAALGVVSNAGCNQVLGNEEGKPYPDAGEAGSFDAGLGDAGVVPATDGGSGAVVCDTSSAHKLCFGLCVDTNDPNFGCGGDSCVACDPKNVVQTACQGGQSGLTCGYDTAKGCKPGFDNCNGNSADGCETALNTAQSCGGCTTKCEGQTPNCARAGAGYACVDACPTTPVVTTNCSGSCVDTQTDVNDCGGCGKKCERANATATCDKGTCVYACNAGTHKCGDTCASESDPALCGASCTPCAKGGPNTQPVCKGGTCDIACAAGFIDCNGDYKTPTGDGCEADATKGCPSTTNCLLGAICLGSTCCPDGVCRKVCPLPAQF